ncbi:MAG: hypothetical protein IT442_17145 [Phycisphaeraceae bacterium]|nr:hypothetical protein [Phycisphaeraceae bacterium]
MPSTTPHLPQKRSLARLLLRLGVVAVILFFVCVGTLTWLWFTPPAYWTAEQARRAARSPDQAGQRAADLKKIVVAFLRGGSVQPTADAPSRARIMTLAGHVNDEELAEIWESFPVDAEGNRLLEIPMDDFNDWLEVEGMDQVRAQGLSTPSWASQPMVTLESGRAVVAMQIDHESYHQVVSAVVNVRLQSDGKIFLRLASVRGGQVPVKGKSAADAVKEAIDNLSPERRQQLEELARGQNYDPADLLRRMGAPEGTKITKLDLSDKALTLGLK